MVDNSNNDTTEVYNQFTEWLTKQPFWLQDATWRIYNDAVIDNNVISTYVQLCHDEINKTNPTYNRINPSQVMRSISKELIIKEIKNVQSVNALAENAGVSFGKTGISVVYGLNGAGKSGFMRIFKHVSSHQYAEPIQKNVFSSTADNESSCEIVYDIDGNEKTARFNLSQPVLTSDFQCCDVFDTRISSAYITNSNNSSCEPFVFTVLKNLADTATMVSAEINKRIEMTSIEELELPAALLNYAEANWLKEITNTSSIPQECLVWETSDEERITSINNLLNEKQIEAEIKSKKNLVVPIAELLQELKDIQSRLEGDGGNKLSIAHQEYLKAEKDYQDVKRIFAENANKYDQIGVDEEVWRQLWIYAREYYDKFVYGTIGIGFAKNNSLCPLCLQKLGGDIQKRFESINEYVNGKYSSILAEKEKAYKGLFSETIKHSYNQTLIEKTYKSYLSEKLFNSLLGFYALLDECNLKNYSSESFSKLTNSSAFSFVAELNEVVSTLTNEIQELEKFQNKEEQLQLRSELSQLEYRKWVYQHSQQISIKINSEKAIFELKKCLQLLKTNKITAESNELAERLITEAYLQRFHNELQRLAPHLSVKLEKAKSSKGQSPYRIVLDTANASRNKPEYILSEGEQRIVSLAAFFADATGRTDRTPIIIDDPISSLDYNFEETATKRLVELAENRQVIVFTHRISLLVGISEQCNLRNVSMCEKYIRSTFSGKGVSDFEDLYHGNVSNQLDGIIKRINEIKEMAPDSHSYIDACSNISQQLRICIERSVEDVLFQKMVTRFSRRIMTGKLLKMSTICDDDCKIIDYMMTKYSYDEHSQPADAPLHRLNLSEVIKDITEFQFWIKGYNKRMGN